MPDQAYRHSDFELLRRWGPTLDERVTGSDRLRKRQLLGRRLTRSTARVRFDGLDRIPATGPVILAANHRAFMDGTILFGYVDRVVSFLVKAEAFAPAGGRVGRILFDGAQIPVRRGMLDPAPVRLALQVLDRGGVVGIFPEGTRGDGLVRHALPGVGYLAVKTGASVVPIAIEGSPAMTRRRAVARPWVTVTVAPPMHFDKVEHPPLNRRHWLSATEQIRSSLAELVSTGHPPTAPVPAAVSNSRTASARTRQP